MWIRLVDAEGADVEAAHTYRLAGFQPAGKVEAGKPAKIAFTIEQPNGKPLTAYKRAPGRTPAST